MIHVVVVELAHRLRLLLRRVLGRLVSERRQLNRSRAGIACRRLSTISGSLRIRDAVVSGRRLPLPIFCRLPGLFLLLARLPLPADLLEF